jgi:hypothetical protein
MPIANINSELRIGTPLSLQQSADALRKALGEIYSRKNLGLNVRTFTTNSTLDVSDALALIDTTLGAVTLTLCAANSWSSRDVAKTPSIMIQHIAGTANVTITAAAGDTINGAATAILVPGYNVQLISDGSTKWFSHLAADDEFQSNLEPPNDVTIAPTHCMIVADYYTIASGKTLTIGAGAVMEIL